MKRSFLYILPFFLLFLLALNLIFFYIDRQHTVSAVQSANAQEQALAEVRHISAIRFLESRAIKLFLAGKFEEALQEFEKLEKEYPQDPLITRYMGICYYRLEKYEEALAQFEKGLTIDPYNIAMHYFKGYTHYRMAQFDQAELELNYVATYDVSDKYSEKAGNLLKKLKEPAVKKAPKVTRKKWKLSGLVGYEYDTNVTLESNVPAFTSTFDQNSSRFLITSGISYDPILTENFKVRIHNEFSQTLHDDTLNELNFSRTRSSVRSTLVTTIFKIPTSISLEYVFEPGFLYKNLFSVNNALETSFTLAITPTTRLEFYNSYAYITFGPDGTDREVGSRDGHYGDSSVTVTKFFPKTQRSIYGTYSYDWAETAGDNFDFAAHATRAGFRSPVPPIKLPLIPDFLLEGWDVGAVFIYRRNDYFNHRELVNRRKGDDWTAVFSFGHNLGKNYRIDGYFRYINANNRNDIFQYDRNIFGTTLSYFF